jgi:hypothetical protein
MKRIVASVGLVAVGATALQADMLPGLTTESGKPWTASATLRGFYDDNFNTIPNNQPIPHGYSRGSAGFEVSPALLFSFPMEQTSITFGAVYSLKYYDETPLNQTQNYDQTFEFDAGLTHAFSERYQITVKDSFVIGQEPDFLRAGNTFTTFQRISGDNQRNYGVITFSAQLTPELSLEAGYANTYYAYADDSYPAVPPAVQTVTPSLAGLMNELDNVAHLDLRYQLQPQTIGVAGFQFRDTDYTANQPIGNYGPPPPAQQTIVMSNERNVRSYYMYAGLDQNFRPDLTGSLRAGAYYSDYYNNPQGQNDWSPYALLSLRYTYLPESYLEFGFTYDYSPSSVFSANNAGDITLNVQAATVYVSLNHRITPKLYGSIIAQFQDSTYYGGPLDGDADKYFLIGLNLSYRFTPNFSAEVGYNYDDFNSGETTLGTYNRNRVYVGVTGSY